jgi:hypothetical protein
MKINYANLTSSEIREVTFKLTVCVKQINSHDSRQMLQLRCQNGKLYAFTSSLRAGTHLKTNIHDEALSFSCLTHSAMLLSMILFEDRI